MRDRMCMLSQLMTCPSGQTGEPFNVRESSTTRNATLKDRLILRISSTREVQKRLSAQCARWTPSIRVQSGQRSAGSQSGRPASQRSSHATSAASSGSRNQIAVISYKAQALLARRQSADESHCDIDQVLQRGQASGNAMQGRAASK
jgi:hypothetical protein